MEFVIPSALAVLFPLVFVAFWVFVCSVLGLLSGWRGLGARFPSDGEEPAGTLHFRSGRMNGFVNYNGVLHLGAGPRGLHLGVFFAFRAGHPTLLVPWDQVVVKGESKLFFTSVTHLEVGGVSLRLPTRTWQEIRTSPYARPREG